MEPDSDKQLVQAAREGDLEAFSLLLQRHRPILVSLCRRALGDEALAEDAAQEATLRAMLRLHTLEQTDRFGSWLAGIGLNVCRASLRARSYERTSWQVLEGARDERLDLESQALARDLVSRVRGAVERLPPGQRSAVRLFYLSGLSYAETATTLGIEVGAVRTRLHKARTALRQQLRDISQEGTAMEGEEKQHICSFCSKPREEVRRMIAGPKGVIICNECIDLCNKILAEEESKSSA
jgi:RNA polymerase sigma-70 factor (ECF subfamily)